MSFHLHPQTFYTMECVRDGRRVWREAFHNLVTTVGKNKLLDAMFKTGEGANAWYVALVDNASFSAYAAADTMGSHAGWIESVAYNEATRQAYVASTPASSSTNNTASRAIFTMNATKTIRGAFLTDSSTKSGTTGTLYGVGDFTVARSVISGDQIYAQIVITVG